MKSRCGASLSISYPSLIVDAPAPTAAVNKRLYGSKAAFNS
jgi:hypothetical protein